MTKKQIRLFPVRLILFFFLAGCSGNKTENKSADQQSAVQVVNTPVVVGYETSALLKDLEENGNYVNSGISITN
jgi:hypothetical protein